ncbi:FdtA/QdtA family cupin domain-containing protein [Sporosarcina sp. FSL K6-2383]|uniref:sugar 3,4-ketoisomerase n=1 Tax=Sporosarcina sp. FSL K6-2383 TaxID=2921556 RepID=UPI00315AA914
MTNHLIKLKDISDERGSLITIENLKEIPFEVRRVYYLYNLTADKARGFHAHKKLKQLFICVHGSCKVLLDDGISKKEYHLTNPNQAVLCDSLVWREMFDFSNDCVFLVLADQFFDEEDYIRDYAQFLEFQKGEIS